MGQSVRAISQENTEEIKTYSFAINVSE